MILPVRWKCVLCSIKTSFAPSVPWNHIFPTFSHRLFTIFRFFACPLVLPTSYPSMFKPCSTFSTTLLLNVRSSVTHHGHLLSWLFDLSKIAKPTCASAQQFSKKFPSTVTRRAFFVSNRFFTVQCLPAYFGSSFFQVSGLKK